MLSTLDTLRKSKLIALAATAAFSFSIACGTDCKPTEDEVNGKCVARTGPREGEVKQRVVINLDSNSNEVSENGHLDMNLSQEYEITATVEPQDPTAFAASNASIEGLSIEFSVDGDVGIFNGEKTTTANTNADGVAVVRVSSDTVALDRILKASFKGDANIGPRSVTQAVNICANCETTAPVIDPTPPEGPTDVEAQAALAGFAFEGPYEVGEGGSVIIFVEAYDIAGGVLPGVDVYISVDDPSQLKFELDPVGGPLGKGTTGTDGRVKIKVTPRQGATGLQHVIAFATRPDGSTVSLAHNLTIVGTRAPSRLDFTASPVLIQPGPSNPVKLSAIVFNANGNPMASARFNFSIVSGPGANATAWGYVEESDDQVGATPASVSYFPGTATGTVTLRAETLGTNGNILAQTLAVTVSTSAPVAATNAADLAQDAIQTQTTMIAIQPDSTVVQSDGVSQIDIDVKPLGAGNQALKDVIVNFSISGGTMAAAQRGSITPAQSTSDSAGVATLVYTAGTTPGTVTIQAEVRRKTDGFLIASNSQVITLINQPIEILQVATISTIASPFSLEPQSPDPAVVDAYPLNVNGVLVEGDYVTFSLLTAGDSGRLVDAGDNRVEYYPGTVTGTIDIQACAGATCDTVQVAVQPDTGIADLAAQEAIQTSATYILLTTPGVASVLSGPANTLQLDAQVMDANNGVVKDVIVNFQLTAGPTGNRADWGAVDVKSVAGANGVAEAVYYGAAVTGTVTVEASVRSVVSGAILISDTLVVQVDPAPSNDQTADVAALILTADRTSVKPGFANTVEISAQALNSTNNPLENLNVYFELETGPTGVRADWGSILYSAKPDSSGIASTTYFAGSVTGDVWVKARAGSITEFIKLTVDVNAGDTTGSTGSTAEQEARQANVAALVLLADNDNLPLGPSHGTRISVWPIGSDNTPQPNVVVSFSVVTGPTLVAQSDWGMIGSSTSTDANGKGEVTYLAGNFPGPVTVRAQVRSVLSATIYAERYYTLNLRSAESDAEAQTAQIHLLTDPATIEQNSTDPMTVRAVALDSNGVLIEADFVDFAVIEPGTPAQVGYLAKGTADNEVLYYPGSQTGGITIEARANGLVQTIDAFVVTPSVATPDQLQNSVARLILTKSQPSVDQGPQHSMDVLAWAVNSNNNPLSGVKVNFAVINGPTVDPVNWGGIDEQVTTSNGLASAEYFAGFETGTVTVLAWVARITDASVVTQTTIDIPVVQAVQDDETPFVDAIVLRLEKTEVAPGFANTVDIEALVLNALGNPLQNVTVDFRLAAGPGTDSSQWGAIRTAVEPTDGIAKTEYFAGSITGAVTIEASVAGVAAQAVITITNTPVTVSTDSIAQEALQSTVADMVLTVDDSDLLINPVHSTQVHVFPIGLNSNPVLGAKVDFVIFGGPTTSRVEWGVIEESVRTTNGTGSVAYYAGTVSGAVTVRAYVRSVTDANIIYATRDIAINLIDPLPAQASVAAISLFVDPINSTLPGPAEHLTIRAQPINAFGNPVNGIDVVFSLISGPSSPVNWGAIDAFGTVSDGIASVNYFAGSVTGAVVIQASVGGVTATTTVNVVLQLPEDDQNSSVQEARQQAAAYMDLSASPTTVVVVPSDEPVALHTRILTSNHNTLQDAIVTYRLVSSTYGSPEDWGGVAASQRTDSNGFAEVFYVPSAVSTSGLVTIEAAVYSVTSPTTVLLSQQITLQIEPVQDDTASIASLSIMTGAGVVAPGSVLPIRAVALNADNNPLVNVNFFFAVTGGTAALPEQWGYVGASADPDTLTGVATSTYYASETPGYVYVTVTAGSYSQTVTLQVTTAPAADDSALVANIILTTNKPEVAPGLPNKLELSAIAIDAQGRPLRNVTFDFEILASTAVSGAVIFDGIPDQDGIATATYIAGTAEGNVAIRATVGAQSTQLSVNVTNNPSGELADDSKQQSVQSLVLIPDNSTLSLLDLSTDIKILTLGANNTAVHGVLVDLAITNGPGASTNWGLIDGQARSEQGIASALYQLPLQAGTVTIEAYVRSVTDFSVIATNFTTITVTNPGVGQDDTPLVSDLLLTADAIQTLPGLDHRVTLSAMALDAQGHPLKNLVIDFEILSPTAVSGAVESDPISNNSIKKATYYAGAVPGIVTIQATVGAFVATVDIEVTNTPAVVVGDELVQQSVQTLVLIAEDSILEDYNDSTDLRALTLGPNNTSVDGVLVDFAVTNGSGPSSGWGMVGARAKSSNGVAVTTFQNPLTSGTITVEAYVRSVTDFSIIATAYTTIQVNSSALEDSAQVAHIILTAAQSEVQPGLENRVPLSAVAINSQGQPLRNLSINFEILAPTAVSGSVSNTGIVGTTGIQEEFYFAGTATGTVTIRASVGAISNTVRIKVTHSPSVGNVNDAIQASVSSILLSADKTSMKLGTDLTNLVKVQTLDANNNRIFGVLVQLYLSNGPTADRANWGAIDGPVMAQQGIIAQSTYHAAVQPGTVTVRAEVRSVNGATLITYTTMDLDILPTTNEDEDQVAAINVSLSQSILEPGLANSTTIQMLALDSGGQVLTDLDFEVQILGATDVSGAVNARFVRPNISSAPTQEGYGFASALYYAGDATGIVTLSVSSGTVTKLVQVAIVNQSGGNIAEREAAHQSVAYLIFTSDKYTIQKGVANIAKLTATAVNAQNVPVPGVEVNFQVLSGPGGASNRVNWGSVISPRETDDIGAAVVDYRAAEVTGTITLDARVSSVLTGALITSATLDLEIEATELEQQLQAAVNIQVFTSAARAIASDVNCDLLSTLSLQEMCDNGKTVGFSAVAVGSRGQALPKVPFTMEILDGPGGLTNSTRWGTVVPANLNPPVGNDFYHTSSYNSGPDVGTVTVLITAGNGLTSTVDLEITEDVGGAAAEQEALQQSVAFLTLKAASDRVVLGGDRVDITALALDNNHVRVKDVIVDFEIFDHSNLPGQEIRWGNLSAADRTVTGETTIAYQSSDSPGFVTIRGTVRSMVNGMPLEVSDVIVEVYAETATQGVPDRMYGPSSLIVDMRDSIDISDLLVLDSNGIVVSDAIISANIVTGPTAFPQNWGALERVGNGFAYFAPAMTGTVTLEFWSGAALMQTTVQIVDPSVVTPVATLLLSADKVNLLPESDQAILTATALDSGNIAIARAPISFEILSPSPVSGFLAVPASAIANEAGILQTSYFSGAATGVVTIRATSGSATADLPILVANQSSLNEAQEQVQQAVQALVAIADPGMLQTGMNSESDIHVLTLGADNVALNNVVVEFAVTNGPGLQPEWGYIDHSATSSNGRATAVFRSPLVAGTVTIEAYVRSVTDFSLIATNFTTITVSNPGVGPDDTGSVANLILAASANEVEPGLGNRVSLSAMAVDAQGQPLRNLVIDWEILSPTAVSGALDGGNGQPGINGIAQATYYAGSALGPVTIRASVGASVAQTVIVVTNTPNAEPIDDAQQQAVQSVVVLANPSSYVLGEDTESAINVLTMGANNVALNGVVVDLAITGGPGGSDNWGLIDSRVTSVDGVAAATYRTPLLAGTVTIEAYVRSVTDFSLIATNFTTITVSNPGVGPDDTGSVANLILSSNVNEVAPGIQNTVSLSALAVDAQGQPLRNLVIDWEILSPTAVSGALDGGNGQPGTNGIAQATYYAGSATGNVRVRASVGAFAATQDILVTNTPNAEPVDNTIQNSVAYLVLTADVNSLDVGSPDAANLTVWALDANNNPVDGAVVDLYLTSGPTGNRANWGLVSGGSTTVDGFGAAEYVAGLVAGTVTVQAEVRTLDSLALVTSTTMNLDLVTPVSQSQESQVAAIVASIDPAIMEQGPANTGELVFMAMDAQGHVLTQLDFDLSIVSASPVSGGVSAAVVTPDAGTGIGTATYYAGTATGVVTISISAGSVTTTVDVAVVENLTSGLGAQELLQQSVQYLILTADDYIMPAGNSTGTVVHALAIDGNSVPIEGVQVRFAILSGPGSRPNWGAIASPISTSTSGEADANYAPGLATGTVVIEASVISMFTNTVITSSTLSIELEQSELDQQIADAAFIVLTSNNQSVVMPSSPPVLINGVLVNVPNDKKSAILSAVVVNNQGQALDLVPVELEIISGPGGITNQADWGSVNPALMAKSGIVNSSTYTPGSSSGTVVFQASTGAVTSTVSVLVTNTWQPTGSDLANETLQASVEYLLLDVDQAEVAKDGHSMIFTATALDAQNNRVDGVVVDFEILGHSALIAQEYWGSLDVAPPTDAGQTSSTYFSSPFTGTVTVQATVRSLLDSLSVLQVTTATVDVIDAAVNADGPVSAIILESDTLAVEEGIANSVHIRAAPIDAAGRLLYDTPLYFRITNGPTLLNQNWGAIQSSASLAAGASYVEVPYFAAAETGAVTVEVSAGAITRTVSIQVIPNVPDTVKDPMTSGYIVVSSVRDRVAAGIQNSITLNAVLFDDNNQPVPLNTEVLTRIVSHSGTANRAQWGLLVPEIDVDAEGRADIKYYSASVTGTVVIEVYSGTITAQISIDVVPDEPSFLGLSIVPGTLDADGSSTADVVVTALDIYGDPVPNGTTIVLSLGYANLGYLTASVVQTTSGSATVQYSAPTSGGVDGTQTVYATLGAATASSTIQLIDLRVTTLGVLAQPQTLELGQQGYVLATLRDVLGQPVAAGTPVTFAASNTTVTLLNTFSPSNVSGTSTIAIVGDFVGTVEVTAYVYGVPGLITDSTIISVQPPASGTISYIGAVPTVVGVRGASSFGNGVIQETAVLTFQVLTGYGANVPDGTVVDFQIDGPVGAELLQTSGTTLNGEVSTTVRSGTVSGTIRVLAEVQFAGTPFYAWSAPVGVQAGPPAQNHTSLSLSTEAGSWALSVNGLSTTGLEGTVRGYLADRFGNPVPEGTQVYFTTEAGIIEANTSTDALGRAEAQYLTAGPGTQELGRFYNTTYQPFDSTSTVDYASYYARQISAAVNSHNSILMVAIGEESFTDQNGNGAYDVGEPFATFEKGEPYLDVNSSGSRNVLHSYLDDNAQVITLPDEPFYDYDQDGVYDAPDGVWNDRTFVWREVKQYWTSDVLNTYLLPSRYIDVNGNNVYEPQLGDMPIDGTNRSEMVGCTETGLVYPVVTHTPGPRLTFRFIAEGVNGATPNGGVASTEVFGELTKSPSSVRMVNNRWILLSDPFADHYQVGTSGALDPSLGKLTDNLGIGNLETLVLDWNTGNGSSVTINQRVCLVNDP